MKDLFRVISVVIILSMAFSIPVKGAEDTFLLGDSDGDGLITITDCTVIQREIAGLSEIAEKNKDSSDIDLDGTICILDATHIQRWLAKMSLAYPIGCRVTKSNLYEAASASEPNTEAIHVFLSIHLQYQTVLRSTTVAIIQKH